MISRERKFKTNSAGFDVIVPIADHSYVPFECSVCNLIMRDADDSCSFREFECCSWCATRWAEPRRKEWIDGWRPLPEDILKESEKRQFSSIRLPTF